MPKKKIFYYSIIKVTKNKMDIKQNTKQHQEITIHTSINNNNNNQRNRKSNRHLKYEFMSNI